jgi:hypothetical protein
VILLLAGLLVWVHPVSAPAWGFALWLGLWLRHPADWGWRRRVRVMLGLGGLFLAALSPFALNYLAHRQPGGQVSYAEGMAVIQAIYPERLGDALMNFARLLWSEGLAAGLAGLGLTLFLAKKRDTHLPLVLAWLAGILLVAVGVTGVERAVESALQILPLQTELVRALRYLAPLLLLFCLWPLALWDRGSPGNGASSSPATHPFALSAARFNHWLPRLAGLLLVSGWLVAHPLTNKLPLVAECLQQGALVCSPDRQEDEALFALQQTPRGTAVLAYNHEPEHEAVMMSTRYLAMRPLVFAASDIFLYSHPDVLERWLTINAEIQRIRATRDPDRRLDALLDLACATGAGVIWIDFDVNEAYLATLPVERLYLSQKYAVLRVTELK